MFTFQNNYCITINSILFKISRKEVTMTRFTTLINNFTLALASFSLSTNLVFGVQNKTSTPLTKAQSSILPFKNGVILNKKNKLNEVKIKKSLLKNEAEFLIHASLIPQIPVASSTGLKSRVVKFKLENDSVMVYESTNGHTISPSTPQVIHLAKLPLIHSGKDEITVDLNKGLSDIFVNEEWRASDFDGTDYSMDKNFKKIKVDESIIKNIRFVDEKNYLVINQTVSTTSNEVKSTSEIVYYITPYTKNDGFKPFDKKQNFERFGYFQSAPYQLENSVAKSFATKFDIGDSNKNITFAVSDNTPAEYKQAVRDGILYWNKAFGKEIMKAIEGKAGETAPSPIQNLIQWITWDDAGFAYADAQIDPRSGEIKHAQVYLTSAFAVSGIKRAQEVINLIHNNNLKTIESKNKIPNVGRSTSFSGHGCMREMDMSYANNLEKILKMNMDKDKKESLILKASQDYVREVTAHEVGHTLGLRHNFAGSLAANYDLKSRDSWIKEYFEKSTSENYQPQSISTSSVMDYQQFPESILSGHQIAHNPKAFEYDEKAIKNLYGLETYNLTDYPLFCTDSHTETHIDCQRFDYGNNVVETMKALSKEGKLDILKSLVRSFIRAKAPNKNEEAKPLNEVTLPPQDLIALIMIYDDFNSLRIFDDATKVLSLQRKHQNVAYTSLEKNESLKEEEVKYFLYPSDDRYNITSYLNELFVVDNQSEINSLIKDVNSYIDLMKTGKGGDNQDYSMSDEEIEYIKKQMKEYITYLKPQLLSAKIKILSGSPAFAQFGLKKTFSAGTNSDYLKILSKYYFDFTLDILTSTSTHSYPAAINKAESIVDKDNKEIKYSNYAYNEYIFLPKFNYSPLKLQDFYGRYLDLRAEAISMYTSQSITQNKFFNTEKAALKKKFEDKIKITFLKSKPLATPNDDYKVSEIDITDPKTFEKLELTPYGKSWIQDNIRVLDLLR